MKRAETILRLRTDRIALVLEHSADYQNIAACVRTAESFGITTVYMVQSATMRVYRSPERDEGDIAAVIDAAGMTSSPSTSSSTVRAVGTAAPPSSDASSAALPSGAAAARSAHSWIEIRPFVSIAECIRSLRADGREIWATDLSPGAQLLATPREAASFARLGIYQPKDEAAASVAAKGIDDLPKRLAIVMGRETDGVSPAFLAAADKRVFIPMVGFAESFNLSVATALVVQKLFNICPEGKHYSGRCRCCHQLKRSANWCAWRDILVLSNLLQRGRVRTIALTRVSSAARGDVSAERVAELRRVWYTKLLAPTRLRCHVAEMVALAERAEAEGDRESLNIGDLRRVTQRRGWNKKLQARMSAADEVMGREDIKAAVRASKGEEAEEAIAISKRARPTSV